MMVVLILGNVYLLQLTIEHIEKSVLLEHVLGGNFIVVVGRLLSFMGGSYKVMGAFNLEEEFVQVQITGIASLVCPLPFLVTNYTIGQHLLLTIGKAF
jgi:hypothetical protein